MCNSFMFCYNRTEGGDFMPVGVLTNVCTVFIGTFIGGLIKKVLPKGFWDLFSNNWINVSHSSKDITNGYYGYYFRFCYW